MAVGVLRGVGMRGEVGGVKRSEHAWRRVGDTCDEAR